MNTRVPVVTEKLTELPSSCVRTTLPPATDWTMPCADPLPFAAWLEGGDVAGFPFAFPPPPELPFPWAAVVVGSPPCEAGAAPSLASDGPLAQSAATATARNAAKPSPRRRVDRIEALGITYLLMGG
jgi:hypothetical protein